MKHSFDKMAHRCQSHLNEMFTFYLQKSSPTMPQLQDAMAYAVLNGGKRIRPLLVYATGYALNAPEDNLKIAAAAIELIHAYSLIHDDLPAMDNADLRRGKPSCHKAFNEPLAILAGDALQPLAFEILASHPATLRPEQRLAMITVLSHAAGLYGMAGGQALDIVGINSLDTLTQMYQLKTGALLVASVKLGAIAANLQNRDLLHSIEKYAINIGLAFQIQDDLLDTEGTFDITGKPHGLDTANKKITYPFLLGKEKTYARIDELYQEALEAIKPLGERTHLLQAIANFLLQRKK